MVISVLAFANPAGPGDPASRSPAAKPDKALVAQGAYLARMGDCTACHTAPGGKPFAGGLAIESPFGAIYSTNITPDKATGIGNYTRDEFAAALRKGIRADGKRLYPAMPYPAYASISDHDIDALYAYFMHGVAPVHHQPQQTDLGFPFNQRWTLMFWDWMFAGTPRSAPAPDGHDAVARGRYLVQGLGHCGSCHTPRGLAFQSKALDDGDPAFLSGAELNGWLAPSLRGKRTSSEATAGDGLGGWSHEDIVNYLATGRNAHAAVAGEMKSVVEHSTSHLNDADLNAIAAYLKTLPSHRAKPDQVGSNSSDARDTTQRLTKATDLSHGGRLYLDNCGACHFADGRGAKTVFPVLDGNSLINADNPTGLIHVILAGAQLPSTPGAPESLMMPGFAWRLNDQDVATLATFLRQAWGNKASKVTARQVADVRKKLGPDDMHGNGPDDPYPGLQMHADAEDD
ncbi:cytochrome c [Salinisphaera sp. Q1T1-3]|nr:cytochrome c [Salinisphaera sp. Q1T1-3]